MSEKFRSPGRGARLIAGLLAFAAMFLELLAIVGSASTAASENPFISVIGCLPLIFLAVLLYSTSALIVGRSRIVAMLVPMAVALLYFARDSQSAVAALLTALTPTVASTMIYSLYKKGVGKSTICSMTAVTVLLLELLRPLTSAAFAASKLGQKFGTVLFERLGSIVDSTLEMVIAAFETAAQLYPGLESALTGSEQALLRSSLSLSISLMPAVLFTVYFAIVFIVVAIIDLINKRKGYLANTQSGLYSVPHSVYIIFNIVTIVYILSLFFGSGLSGFFAGIVSALLFLLPHFLILAYRRLFFLLSRVCGDFFAIVLLIVLTGAGMLLSTQLTLWVLAFFGSSEHRAQYYAQIEDEE